MGLQDKLLQRLHTSHFIGCIVFIWHKYFSIHTTQKKIILKVLVLTSAFENTYYYIA